MVQRLSRSVHACPCLPRCAMLTVEEAIPHMPIPDQGTAMMTSDWQACLRDMAKREQARTAQEVVDAQVKIITATFDKAVAYTNIMIAAGYAGYFGLWQFTKDLLSRQQALWSALLVLVSLVSFILFEVAQMIVITRSVQRKIQLSQQPDMTGNPEGILQRLHNVESAQQGTTSTIMRFWMPSVLVSIGTALIGAGILAWAFVSGLLNSGQQ